MAIPVFDSENNLIYIEVKDIFAIYKEDKTRKIVVRSEKGEHYFPWTLEQISLIMSDYDFAQIDKNKIVNLYQVKDYSDKKVTVDGNTYEVSRRRKVEFEKKLQKYRSRNTNG